MVFAGFAAAPVDQCWVEVEVGVGIVNETMYCWRVPVQHVVGPETPLAATVNSTAANVVVVVGLVVAVDCESVVAFGIASEGESTAVGGGEHVVVEATVVVVVVVVAVWITSRPIGSRCPKRTLLSPLQMGPPILRSRRGQRRYSCCSCGRTRMAYL